MTDDTTTVADLRATIAKFVAEREWEPFHSPKNLAISLAIEAAELMEHFQWLTIDESRAIANDSAKRAAAGEELADVLAYLLAMANALHLDVSATFQSKLAKNAEKYPVDLSRGRHERPDLTKRMHSPGRIGQ
ncbi:MAG: nucleotide pyrophosphohydrolase [Pirellulales bacterium]